MPSQKAGNEIIKITRSKGQIKIFLLDEEITLSENSFTDFTLYEGKKLTAKEVDSIKEASRLDPLQKYALSCLSKGSLSEKDLGEKLYRRGARKLEVYTITKNLKKAGLLDDEAYAREFAKEVAELRLYGRNKIIFELRKRGIADKLIQEVLPGEDKERQKAERYLETLAKKLSHENSRRRRQKAYQALITRGFEEGLSHSLADSLPDNEASSEREKLQREYDKAKARYARKCSGYQLRQKLTAYLLSRGYSYEDINSSIQEDEI